MWNGYQNTESTKMKRTIGRMMSCTLLMFWALQGYAQTPAGGMWQIAGSSWNAEASEGNGRSEGSEWATLLSRDWYGKYELSGKLSGQTPGQCTAIIVRYAGKPESYTVVVDWKRSRLILREKHFGESVEAMDVGLTGLGSQAPTSFHITTAGNHLRAVLWPENGSESSGVTLEYSDMKIPAGRVGLGVYGGKVSYSELRLRGTGALPFEPYAFHCNYRLAERGIHQPLWEYLNEEGEAALARNRRTFKSVQEFEEYRKAAVLKLRQSLGLDPWPERTKLNARVVGTVERRGYKIEKIIFESQPGFLVDALLYLPTNVTSPVPGVLSTIGHWDDGFFIWSEQGRCIGLAKKGYAVLTFDPISQGQRKWLGNGDHDKLRRKIILSGMEVSGLMFWDSIRAIDYLVSRPEVDPTRIGVTGVSGGGFNALYTAVLDERVKAVAPDGYATAIEALIKRVGAGCCAYLPNMTQYAEIPDIYGLVAPRRMLILGGYMDVLSDRMLDVYEEAQKAYKLYGAEENLQYYLDRDGGHTYSKPMRLAMYRWFNKWLKGTDDPAEAVEPVDPEDFLISSESGLLQVFAPGERGRDVIDLERDFLAQHQQRLTPPTTAADVPTFQQRVQQRLVEMMGEKPLATLPPVASDDQAHGPGSVRHVTLKTDRNLPVPVEIHSPQATGNGTLLLYFSMSERYPTSELSAAEMVEKLVHRGFTVAVPQVRGTGPTKVNDTASAALYSMALGKHLFSTRLFDLQRVMDFLGSQPAYKPLRLMVWGEGPREGIMGLYLAAIDSRVQTVVSSHGLVSYQNIVDEDGLPDFDYYLPGILRYADVGDFMGAVAPRRVIVSGAVNINNQLLSREQTARAYAAARNIYRFLGHEDHLVFAPPSDLLEALAQRQSQGGIARRRNNGRREGVSGGLHD